MIGWIRQRRFRDIVRRQMTLFANDHRGLVDAARSELDAYNDTRDTTDAQEHYGRYDDLCEDIEDLLYEMCEQYGSHLPESTVRWYVREFDRQARRRYRDVIPRLNLQVPQATPPNDE